jgi:moderate conductance mechanosensitive channel
METRLFDAPVDWRTLVAALLPTILIAWLGARFARRIAAAAIRRMLPDVVTTASPAVRRPLRLVWIAVFILLLSLLLFPAFQLAGLRPRTGVHLGTLSAWAFTSGLKVILIIVIAYALIRTIGLLVTRFEHELSTGTTLDALERAKRARTLGAVISKGTTVLIGGIAALMVLREFRVDIAPVLTGAGIVGLAVGFGAQTLVRDVISGFFLILEDQVRVGDVAAINGIGGLVEEINLRTIVLRDGEGTVHVFPNGSITTLANRSKDFSFYVVDLGISYREDPDRVAGVLRDLGAELQADPKYGPFILAPLEVFGVDAFADWSVTLKFRIKTMPTKQWEVGRELRRRIKKRFDELGIEIPFPERIVTVREDDRGGDGPGHAAAKAAG